MDNGYSNARILEIIKDIRQNKKVAQLPEGQRIGYFSEQYPDFFSKFPKLFFAAIDNTFDIRFFELMLNQRAMVLEKPSKETFDAVNTSMHERLNEKYVYPVISKEKLEEAALQAQGAPGENYLA